MPSNRRRQHWLCDEEFPFDHTLTLARDLSTFLTGLDVDTLCASCLLANVLMRPESFIFYSRDRSGFRHRAAPGKARITRDHLAQTVDRLAAAGFVESVKTMPSRHSRYRSRFRATPQLIDLLRPLSAHDLSSSRSLLMLRDRNGRDVEFRNTRRTRRMAAEIAKINKFIGQHKITVRHTDALYDIRGFLSVRGQSFNPNAKSYGRIFNGNFSNGGRLYGPFWQNLPSDIRGGICIDGMPTAEIDIRACHPRLARAIAGQSPFDDDADPYALGGVPRAVAKLAFLVAMNAVDKRQAVGALANEMRKRSLSCELRPAEILNRLLMAMPDVRFFLRRALRLQAIDADIAIAVHLESKRQGFVTLSVHDSFIARVDRKEQLEDLLNATFNAKCDQLRAQALKLRRRKAAQLFEIEGQIQ